MSEALSPPRRQDGKAAELREGLVSSDVIVIGAGPAGLTAAHRLSAEGKRVVVIDAAPACGGSHRSFDFAGCTFDAGSVFLERDHPLFAMFPSARAGCMEFLRRQERIAPDGRIKRYPFTVHEVLGWPRMVQIRAIFSLLRHRFTKRHTRDVEEACSARLGALTYRRSGLAHYIERLHRKPASAIGPLFYESRMGFVHASTRWRAMARLVWRALRKKPPRKGGPAVLLVRPPEGFSAIYDEVRRALEARGVQFLLNRPVETIEKRGEAFNIGAGTLTLTAPNVVSTMPLDRLHRLLWKEPSGLESGDLLTLFVATPGPLAFDSHVLFNFHKDGNWKRITVYSAIYGTVDGRHYFAVEITTPEGGRADPDAEFEAFRAHADGLRLFTGPLSLLGSTVTRSAYPIYDEGAAARMADVIERIEREGVILTGRLGRFDYLPTSSLVIEKTKAELTRAREKAAIE